MEWDSGDFWHGGNGFVRTKCVGISDVWLAKGIRAVSALCTYTHLALPTPFLFIASLPETLRSSPSCSLLFTHICI